MICPRCGAQNSSSDRNCPQCIWNDRRAAIGLAQRRTSTNSEGTLMTVTSPDRDKHISFTLRGSKLKQEFFHQLLQDFDRDWPFQPSASLICNICHGGIYKAPRFQPMHLKALASQINSLKSEGHLKLKIKSYSPASACFDIARARYEASQGKV